MVTLPSKDRLEQLLSSLQPAAPHGYDSAPRSHNHNHGVIVGPGSRLRGGGASRGRARARAGRRRRRRRPAARLRGGRVGRAGGGGGQRVRVLAKVLALRARTCVVRDAPAPWFRPGPSVRGCHNCYQSTPAGIPKQYKHGWNTDQVHTSTASGENLTRACEGCQCGGHASRQEPAL